jgi:hypothetical protein
MCSPGSGTPLSHCCTLETEEYFSVWFQQVFARFWNTAVALLHAENKRIF